jgi:hypothetical protein
MSRTIRKRTSRIPNGQIGFVDFCRWRTKPETRDCRKKDKWKQWCFNNIHRTYRSVEREQINLVYKLDNYEDTRFNDSRAEMKRRSVWWEIY